MSEREEGVAYAEGYREAVKDCLALMAKWFFMSNKDAKACVEEMRVLSKPYE